MASFSLATARPFRDPEAAARGTKTEWHRVAVFPPQLRESVMRDVRKGSREGGGGRRFNGRKQNYRDGLKGGPQVP